MTDLTDPHRAPAAPTPGEAELRLRAASVSLAAACRAWVDYFDRLARDDEPGDPLAAARNSYHAKRVQATRAALDKAGLTNTPPAVAAGERLDQSQEVLEQQLIALTAERDKLAAFKQYVHDRLDAAGVPADPESPHKAEGCRIGGRLDCVLGERADVARLVEALRYYADPGHWAANGVYREILTTDGGTSQSFDHGRHARAALARHGKASPAAATDPRPELPEDADGAPLPTVEMIAAAFSETIFWNNCMPWPDDQGDHWPLESIRPVPPAYRPKVGQIWDGDAATLLRFIDGECSVDVAILPPQVDDADNGSVTSEADADFIAKLPVYVPILLAEIDRLRAKAAR